MLVTETTRNALRTRREMRDMSDAGWLYVCEGGGPLWELYRGARGHEVISHVQIAACGKALWIKTRLDKQRIA